MVNCQLDLKSLVLEAWRERWTEYEWSVNLKAVLMSGCSDTNRLAELIIRQATISEEPNQLMFTYLNFSLAAKVMTHSSLLEALITFNDFSKELCISALLQLINSLKDRLRPDAFELSDCQRMCVLVRRLFNWFLDAINYYIESGTLVTVNDLIQTISSFGQSQFVSFCLYFDSLENSADFDQFLKRFDDVLHNIDDVGSCQMSEEAKLAIKNVVQCVKSLPNIKENGVPDTFGDLLSLKIVDTAHATMISIAILYGSIFLAEPTEKIVSSLAIMKDVHRTAWSRVARDFIRGSFLLQQEAFWQISESHMTAFAYLKVPRVLQQLVEQRHMSPTELIDALVQLAHFHALFNALDMRSKCDCFHYFLTELNKLNLINKTDLMSLIELRNKDKTNMSDSSPGSQASISLVLKAEPTLQTLLKSFHSEFAQKQDKLVQMMHHMISGKSFEFICAAAAATERLSTFAGKLVDFNESSKCSGSIEGEKVEDTVLRSELFDLSFLLLSRIVQHYTFRPVLSSNANASSFFVSWCMQFAHSNKSRDSNTAETMETAEESNDDSSFVDEMWRKLKLSQSGWVDEKLDDWSVICKQIPAIGERLLKEIRDDTIMAEECKNVFSGLLYVNVNGTHWMCSMLLGLAQWLVGSQSECTERNKCAAILNNFVEVHLSPPTSERTKLTDRQAFMANVTKRLLCPLLIPDPVPSPPCPWPNLGPNRSGLSKNGPPTSLPCFTSTPPPADLFKQQFSSALRHRWLTASTLSLVERYNFFGQPKSWIKVCIEELQKLNSVDELNLWSELCIACCLVGEDSSNDIVNADDGQDFSSKANQSNVKSILAFADIISTFVFDSGRELYCVSPRGVILSRLLVQFYVLALRLVSISAPVENSAETEGPTSAKLRKMGEDDCTEQTNQNHLCCIIPDSIASLYKKFEQSCPAGEITPHLCFVSTFLRFLAVFDCNEAVYLRRLVPPRLVSALVRTDPDALPKSVILSLYDLTDKSSRQCALQNIFLLRQTNAL